MKVAQSIELLRSASCLATVFKALRKCLFTCVQSSRGYNCSVQMPGTQKLWKLASYSNKICYHQTIMIHLLPMVANKPIWFVRCKLFFVKIDIKFEKSVQFMTPWQTLDKSFIFHMFVQYQVTYFLFLLRNDKKIMHLRTCEEGDRINVHSIEFIMNICICINMFCVCESASFIALLYVVCLS